jgi:hypothetical protein
MLQSYVLNVGILLQLLVFFRGFFTGNVKRFPYFYVYIASGLAQSAVYYFVLFTHAHHATRIFWLTQFISLFIGCGLILEIFSHVLALYPGAEKFAKWTCTVVFAGIFLLAALYLAAVPSATLVLSELELERNVRSVQVVFFAAILMSILYYRIVLGRNMSGMICGYGLYLGTSVVTLAFRFYQNDTAQLWRTIRPMSFDVSLLIWLLALWSYHPGPLPTRDMRLESDYEAFAARTRQAMTAMRSYLGRSVRS